LESFHDNQRKVCEEIVDVVDLHLEEFYEIATKMQSVQDKLSKADELYSTVTSNVSALRGNILEQESKLKVSLETYELK
jgi:DNA anti-recombination protein RmuC